MPVIDFQAPGWLDRSRGYPQVYDRLITKFIYSTIQMRMGLSADEYSVSPVNTGLKSGVIGRSRFLQRFLCRRALPCMHKNIYSENRM